MYNNDANKHKTSETITGTMSNYGLTVPTSGYDGEDRLVGWNVSLVGDWDFENKLASAGVDADATSDILQKFDALGQRIARDDGTTTTIHVQSGQQTIADYGNRYTYTGREWDGELGLYHDRACMYDPVAGGFVSKDPIGFAAGDANLYRYVGNGVTTNTDPSGLWTFSLGENGEVIATAELGDNAESLEALGYDPEVVNIPHGIQAGTTVNVAPMLSQAAQEMLEQQQNLPVAIVRPYNSGYPNIDSNGTVGSDLQIWVS